MLIVLWYFVVLHSPLVATQRKLQIINKEVTDAQLMVLVPTSTWKYFISDLSLMIDTYLLLS